MRPLPALPLACRRPSLTRLVAVCGLGLLATLVGAVGTRAGKALIAALTAATISITLDQIVYFVLFSSLAMISFIIALCWE